ncbi:hypothetical protein SNL152K_10760 [Streptomyces sp. NL15-2K]|nr:hypothetical protein SNL152K_10760 [Streptomyces sp. NL15-2K]
MVPEIAGHGGRVGHRLGVQDVQLAAGGQADEDHRVAQVGHLRLEQAVPRALARPVEPVGRRGDVVGQRSVGDHDALGGAGRAGRVHHVGQARRVRCGGRLGGQGLRGGPGGQRLVEPHDRHTHRPLRLRERGTCVAVREEHSRTTVGEHERPALGRKFAVNGQVGRAGLPHAQDRRDHLGAARQAQTHHRFGAHAQPAQMAGQPPGGRVQLPVRHLYAAGHQGRRVRRRGHPVLEQGGDRRAGVGHRRVVPLAEHPVPFPGVEDVHSTQPHVRALGNRPQHPDEPARHPLRRLGVEQVCGEGHLGAQPRRVPLVVERLTDGEVQVVARRGSRDRVRRASAYVHAGQCQLDALDVLHGEHHLEQRMPGQRPFRSQLLHQPLERHVLMREGLEARLPHLRQDVPELRIPRQIGADHECVDEGTDQVLQRLVGAPRDRDADRYVRPRAEPRQQQRKGGLKGHVRGDALGAGELHQPLVDVGRNRERHPVPATARHRRPRQIRGQRQLVRRPGQRPPPVVDLGREPAVRIGLVAQQFPLPEGVVGVLHRQRLPRRGLATRPRLVRHRQVPGQRPHRPAVGGDVMQHHHQKPIVRSGLEQPGPDGQFGGKIEGIPHRPAHGIGRLTGLHPGHFQVPVEIVRVENLLVRLSVHGREERPQRLVPRDHIPERLRQHRGVHLTAQVDRRRDVVRRARPFELGQEPQAALRERQRHPLRTRRSPQRRTNLPSRLGQPCRHPGDRRHLEQRP